MPSGGSLQFNKAGTNAYMAQTGPDIYWVLGPVPGTSVATWTGVFLTTPQAIVGTYGSVDLAMQGCMLHYAALAA